MNINNNQIGITSMGLALFLMGLVAYHAYEHPLALWVSGAGAATSLFSVRRK